MKLFIFNFIAILSLAFVAQAESKQSLDRPNVLFILADDMSYEALGAAGILDIDTPNLDTLAASGARFTHAYNMGAYGEAVCAASRTMLNTGRFLWDAPRSLKTSVKEHLTWSQRMQSAGYQTYFSGKWHVPGVEPDLLFNTVKDVRKGMPGDFYRKGSADGSKRKGYGYGRPKNEAHYENGWKPWDRSNGGYWEGGTHWSEVLADDGVAFFEQAAEEAKPFFMYLAFNAPHDPRQSPKEYIDRYPLERIQLPENFLPKYPYAANMFGRGLRDENLMPKPRTEYAVKVHRQEYFALVTHMDDQIGHLLEVLKDLGLADNTYIVFTADNGLALGHHGLGGKQNMYDPSMRVPFLVVGPDVKPGTLIDTPIYMQDVMPTSLELAGASVAGVDFKSLLPLLREECDEHYEAIYGGYTRTQRMVTKGDWKLIFYPTAQVELLFNLSKDPNEMNDLAGNPECAVKLAEMRAELVELGQAMNEPTGRKRSKAKKSKNH
jgi:choline-sulfatase